MTHLKRSFFLLIILIVAAGIGGASLLAYRKAIENYRTGELFEIIRLVPQKDSKRIQAPITVLKEKLDQKSLQYSFFLGSTRFNVYRTRHSMTSCKTGGVIIRDGSKALTYSTDLLKGSKKSGWMYFEPASFMLFGGGPKSPFGMYGSGQVYTNTHYYNAGLILWKFTAAGRLAGNELPQVILTIDDKKIGVINVSDTNFRTYELQSFLNAGLHTIRIKFINDFFDRAQKLDRNVLMSRLIAESIPSVVVVSASGSNLNIEYCTSDRVEPYIETADVDGNVQESILMPPSSKIVFRLKLPKNPRLRFAITSIPDNRAAAAPQIDFAIRVKPIFKSQEKVFSYRLPSKAGWQNQDIDLQRFAEKRVIIELESSTDLKFLKEARTFAVSNPLLFSSSQVPRKPVQHVFIITADALRADHLGCYGFERPTSPNIDQFARDAVLFSNAVSQGAATLPSTASLFTSWYPSAHMTDVNTSRLPSSFLTLPEIFRAAGYMTAGYVQNEFLNPPHGLTDGFLWYFYDKFGRKTEERIKPALKWIQDMKAFPTFVFFHMLHPHSPYVPPPEFANLFHVSLMPLASSNQKLIQMDQKRESLPEPERQQLITLYDAEIRHLDSLFGQFIHHLKRLNIYDDSLIIFLSDHGEAFREHERWGHGGTVYQETIHVPLIVKFPAAYNKKGLVISSYVQTMDLMPTILEFLSWRQPQTLQGQSLLPLVNGHTNDRTVFSEVLSAGILAIVKNEMKYIFTGWSGKEELYDLKSDPAEKVDISTKHPDLMRAFRAERFAYTKRMADWRRKYIGSQAGEHIALDEAQTEELRALGYIQ